MRAIGRMPRHGGNYSRATAQKTGCFAKLSWQSGTIYAIFVTMHALCRALPRCVLLAAITLPFVVQADQAVYTDSLQNGWLNYGWATLDYNNSSPVHSGTKSIAVTITTTNYEAIYIAH